MPRGPLKRHWPHARIPVCKSHHAHPSHHNTQAADQALYLRPGAPPKRASWAGVAMRRGGQRVAKPELLAAEAPVLHMDHSGEPSIITQLCKPSLRACTTLSRLVHLFPMRLEF